MLGNCFDLDQIGAVDLPLHCAQAQDSEGKGLEYWRAGSPANDFRSELYQRRIHCYELVLDSLSVFETRCTEVATVGSTAAPSEDAEAVRNLAFELAFASDDEMFHSTLYDWVIARGLADELLDVSVDVIYHPCLRLTYSCRCGLPIWRPILGASPPRYRSCSYYGSSMLRMASLFVQLRFLVRLPSRQSNLLSLNIVDCR